MAHNILIVDDEPQMLIAMRETMRSLESIPPPLVDTASSAIEALSRLERGSYDLIITDMSMPEMTGLELLRHCSARLPQTPVIMVTAYGTVEQAVEAMKLGAFDYLLKPFSATQLKALAGRALNHSATDKNHSSNKNRTRPPIKIIAEDSATRQIIETARHVAASRTTVLLQAESGTGKEVIARFIHENSPRANRPFIAVNCAAVPEQLLESELFGHEKGSFTGAVGQKIGKFEAAQGGTILLDEVSEMAPMLQAKLLRVLQEREIDRVGGTRPIPIDVRVIATTNRNLVEQVKSGGFREDLYYRLNVVPLTLPPLRERRGDIIPLADYFCRKYSLEMRQTPLELTGAAREALFAHRWPGNVRELENVLQRAVALSLGPVIGVSDLMLPVQMLAVSTSIKGDTVEDAERNLILQTLAELAGNRTHAARKLGISIRTLRNKLRDYREAGIMVDQPGEKILPSANSLPPAHVC